ncbi:MAG TPA: VanZ family protein [Bacteroidetes bacterium]|nr:vanZ like family protein [bacterium BMS3Bbin04]HDO65216.1 VanZ family protein [Bacteroidota bacterium]HEX04341.1 VanZ family protein [Bacteroidota bacterium]
MEIRDQKSFWLALAWAVFLFVLSSIPSDAFPELKEPLGFDKLIHLLLYGVLGALGLRGWPGRNISPWIVFVFCVGYGVTDELHQYFVPGRTPDIWDWLADTVGSLIGVLGMWGWMRAHKGSYSGLNGGSGNV